MRTRSRALCFVARRPSCRLHPCARSVAAASLAPRGRGGRRRREAVYELKCASCHGVKGEGKGPGAELLVPRPRDFTPGCTRSARRRTRRRRTRTSSGSSPTGCREPPCRLGRFCRRGTGGTWWRTSRRSRRISSRSAQEARAAQGRRRRRRTSIKRGKEMYEAIECHKCHGTRGAGRRTVAGGAEGRVGAPIAPANLAKRWTFRGGAAAHRDRHAHRQRGARHAHAGLPRQRGEARGHLAPHQLHPVAGAGDGRGTRRCVTVDSVSDAIPDDPKAEFWAKIARAAHPADGPGDRGPPQLQPRHRAGRRSARPTTTRRSPST